MPPSVPDRDWSVIDSWWGSFRQEEQLVLASTHIRQMDDTWKGRNWESVDSFWMAFEADHEPLFAKQHIRELTDDSKADAWTAVHDLRDSYAEHQQTDLAELHDLMATLSEAWTAGASQFDADPLTTNWRPDSQYEGPLRTSIDEEDWSQWLAHLFRTSTGAFVQAFLGTPDRPPERVRREVVFFGERANRRADILVEYEDTAVSIEVKNGDEHYGKTPHTAGLIERHDDRDWSHVLLLQEDRLPRLRQTFDEDLDLSEEDTPTIRSDQSADIDVRYWQDVSRSLRRMLLDGSEPDSHWEASAYLFITLIEQRLLEFHSRSFVDLTTATGSSGATDSRPTAVDTDPTSDAGTITDTTGADKRPVATNLHRLVAVEPSAQIDYLRSVLQEDHEHE